MKKRTRVNLIAALAMLGIMVVTACLFWGRTKLEIQVQAMKNSSDGKWTAVVEMEAYSAPAFVDDAVYAVRLKGPAQKDRLGDLVMNLPVNYPDHAPSIDWTDGKLVLTLTNNEKHQYLANPVDGVSIAVQQN